MLLDNTEKNIIKKQKSNDETLLGSDSHVRQNRCSVCMCRQPMSTKKGEGNTQKVKVQKLKSL